VVICLERGADCLHMVQLMPMYSKTPSSLASFKSKLVLPFWYRLTQVVLEKRPLNECSSSYCGLCCRDVAHVCIFQRSCGPYFVNELLIYQRISYTGNSQNEAADDQEIVRVDSVVVSHHSRIEGLSEIRDCTIKSNPIKDDTVAEN